MVVSIAREGAERARTELERCIAGGGMVLFPADTLYGLACDPQDAGAIERIHALKGRDEGKPSAVMFFAPLAMRGLLSTVGPRTRDALGSLLPGPVTAVVANPEHRYPLACRDDPERLGLRLIEGPLAGARCAIFQTSANPSGEPAPSRFEDVDPKILDGVDLAIDGGELGGAPSTVVDLTALEGEGKWEVLREGALPRDELERRLREAFNAAEGTPSPP
jgi:L-threonylcarbamoyladenylate synthase